MANPNIVNVTSIYGKTDTFALTTASANLVTATANTVFKINSILVTNIDGTNAADVTVSFYDGTNTRGIKKNDGFRFSSGLKLPPLTDACLSLS